MILIDFKVSVDLVAQRMNESADKAKSLFVTAIKKIGTMQWDDEIMEAKVFYAFFHDLLHFTLRERRYAKANWLSQTYPCITEKCSFATFHFFVYLP